MICTSTIPPFRLLTLYFPCPQLSDVPNLPPVTQSHPLLSSGLLVHDLDYSSSTYLSAHQQPPVTTSPSRSTTNWPLKNLKRAPSLLMNVPLPAQTPPTPAFSSPMGSVAVRWTGCTGSVHRCGTRCTALPFHGTGDIRCPAAVPDVLFG